MNLSQINPCKKGHISDRRKSGNCIQCERERYKDPKRQAYVKAKQAERRAIIKADPVRYEASKAYMKAYTKKNRKKLNQQGNINYAKNNIKIRLQRKGIIPTNEIIKYIKNHSGHCDICGSVGDGRWSELAFDHCHDSLKFRGLLCSQCNRALGHLKDDPKIIERALAYVQHYK